MLNLLALLSSAIAFVCAIDGILTLVLIPVVLPFVLIYSVLRILLAPFAMVCRWLGLAGERA